MTTTVRACRGLCPPCYCSSGCEDPMGPKPPEAPPYTRKKVLPRQLCLLLTCTILVSTSPAISTADPVPLFVVGGTCIAFGTLCLTRTLLCDSELSDLPGATDWANWALIAGGAAVAVGILVALTESPNKQEPADVSDPIARAVDDSIAPAVFAANSREGWSTYGAPSGVSLTALRYSIHATTSLWTEKERSQVFMPESCNVDCNSLDPSGSIQTKALISTEWANSNRTTLGMESSGLRYHRNIALGGL